MNEVEWVTCPTSGCGYSPFPMEKSYRARVQKTGERFLCPAGHGIVYGGGLSVDQRRVQELERSLVAARRDADYWRDRALLAEKTCHWVECGFRASTEAGLATHMRARHGMPSLALVREAS